MGGEWGVGGWDVVGEGELVGVWCMCGGGGGACVKERKEKEEDWEGGDEKWAE